MKTKTKAVTFEYKTIENVIHIVPKPGKAKMSIFDLHEKLSKNFKIINQD